MDGDHKECPIVPDTAITLSFGNMDIFVAASHDSIQVFPDHKFNYLRYWDPQEGAMKAVWLDPEDLSALNDSGIPVTSRESLTESEFESYQLYVGALAVDSEVSVVPVTDQFDAELNYYLSEWE